MTGSAADDDVIVPPKPAQLSAVASEVWDETCRQLVKMRTISVADLFMLEAYCEIVARAREYRAALAENGHFYESITRSGKRRYANPELSALVECEKQIRAFSQEWGLSAAARKRLEVDKGQGHLMLDDPTAGY